MKDLTSAEATRRRWEAEASQEWERKRKTNIIQKWKIFEKKFNDKFGWFFTNGRKYYDNFNL